MRRRFALALALACSPLATLAEAEPAQPGSAQCWFDHVSEAERRDLVYGYMRVQRAEGKARADAWAQEQKATLEKRAIEQGDCPGTQVAEAVPPTPEAEKSTSGDRPLNKAGETCRHLELRNVNVPNPFGNGMSFALLQVCTDDD